MCAQVACHDCHTIDLPVCAGVRPPGIAPLAATDRGRVPDYILSSRRSCGRFELTVGCLQRYLDLADTGQVADRSVQRDNSIRNLVSGGDYGGVDSNGRGLGIQDQADGVVLRLHLVSPVRGS